MEDIIKAWVPLTYKAFKEHVKNSVTFSESEILFDFPGVAKFAVKTQKLLWLAFFIAFAVKLPMFQTFLSMLAN